jgi:quercetin dioxygenase-like cupin family protein
MRMMVGFCLASVVAFAGPALGQDQGGLAKPNLLLKQVIDGMPRGEKQEVRILTARFKPGDRTVFHTHRFPVTVYIRKGSFTLEMEGHPTMTVKAGEGMVEPPNVRMTGFNRSATEETEVVIFYVSDPDTPFLDLVQ